MNEQEQDLAELVSAAAVGNRRALQKVMVIIYPQVLRYARARIGGHKSPTPEDVAQEICLACAKAIPKYTDQGRPFMAFVYGIASNKVADALRAYSRDVSTPTDEVPDQVFSGGTPEDAALVTDGSNRVRGLLDSLSDKARDIIILRVFQGLSAEETAEIVGSTPGAVRVAQHRALAALRARLTEESDNT